MPLSTLLPLRFQVLGWLRVVIDGHLPRLLMAKQPPAMVHGLQMALKRKVGEATEKELAGLAHECLKLRSAALAGGTTEDQVEQNGFEENIHLVHQRKREMQGCVLQCINGGDQRKRWTGACIQLCTTLARALSHTARMNMAKCAMVQFPFIS